MFVYSRRRIAAPIAATALASGVILAGIPASAAPVTTTFGTSCLATPSAVAGPTTQSQSGSVIVDAPESIGAGETFEVTIQPGPIAFPGSASGATVQNVSRIKVDVDVPANATLVEATIVPGTSAGLSGVAPNILRVNENGNVDPNGTILRLSGNNQVIGNSPSSSINSEGGIVVKATGKNVDGSNNADGYTQFQLPQVKAVLKAGDSGDVAMKVRTGGSAGAWNNDRNFLTFLPKATLVITAWAPTRCTPRDAENGPLNSGAGPLATTRIIEADKATTTTVVGPANAKNGTPVTLSANVSGGANGGTVQFFDGDNPLEDAVPVTGGSASISPTFTEDGPHSITASYSGAPGFLASTSASAKIVTVTTDAPPDAVTTTATVSPSTAKVGQDVNLTAKVDPQGTGGTVDFIVDGTETVSAPVGTDGVAVAPYTFTSTGTHKVVAKFTGSPGFAPSAAPAFPVSVTTPAPADVETTTVLDAVGTVQKNTPVTLKATVDPSGATGKVQFKVGDTLIGGPVDVVNGVATVPATFYNSGTYSVTAEFVGASGYTASASAPQTLTVPGDTDGGPGGGTGSLDLGTLFGSLGG
ncbi:Ig-like domain-containing protein [Rhodococcus qingshengii]|jgi:hypothetical protein|uniref:Ig-like domain-containing protein n=2 Tax=Rhodococcus TaxID=1827 RepID=A0AB38RHZ2_RHOSG|nr:MULTISPECIES: Ig-like domain-containing protein [Rhodococcus]EEN89311.1 hypothetical protein RHOER0001_4431 [Rhodococcus erythropolis SK121]MYV28791.1 Ig-like domain repeat protein [Rhodococcus erythropolis]NHE62780.1 Ig-like domain repeat protein [Rhodococcus sp. D-46]ARE33565.1 hypothetical protein A0W34_09605 [Rhodococcus sp. BH4]AUS31368.1 Ig-like domain repeat protein [Rhodococcus qingshengii]